MSDNRFSLPEVQIEITKIVARFPDTRISDCQYRQGNGGPLCLIGHVFARVGVLDQVVRLDPEAADFFRVESYVEVCISTGEYKSPEEAADEYRRNHCFDGNDSTVASMKKELGEFFTEEAIAYMDWIQSQQDKGAEWGELDLSVPIGLTDYPWKEWSPV